MYEELFPDLNTRTEDKVQITLYCSVVDPFLYWFSIQETCGSGSVFPIRKHFPGSGSKSVLRSRHFFGLRLWKSEVPEPTPAPTKLAKKAAAGDFGSMP